MVGRLVCYAFIENKRKQYYGEVGARGYTRFMFLRFLRMFICL